MPVLQPSLTQWVSTCAGGAWPLARGARCFASDSARSESTSRSADLMSVCRLCWFVVPLVQYGYLAPEPSRPRAERLRPCRRSSQLAAGADWRSTAPHRPWTRPNRPSRAVPGTATQPPRPRSISILPPSEAKSPSRQSTSPKLFQSPWLLIRPLRLQRSTASVLVGLESRFGACFFDRLAARLRRRAAVQFSSDIGVLASVACAMLARRSLELLGICK